MEIIFKLIEKGLIMLKTLYLKILLMLNLSKYMFIWHNFNHHCEGEACHICPFIYKLIDQNHVLTHSGVFKFILLFGLILIISLLIKRFINKNVDTLVGLKVELTS